MLACGLQHWSQAHSCNEDVQLSKFIKYQMSRRTAVTASSQVDPLQTHLLHESISHLRRFAIERDEGALPV